MSIEDTKGYRVLTKRIKELSEHYERAILVVVREQEKNKALEIEKEACRKCLEDERKKLQDAINLIRYYSQAKSNGKQAQMWLEENND